MKMIKGTELCTNECGGNYWSWFSVGDQDLLANPGAVAEPVGSFNYAACYVAREVADDGKILDVRVVANPTQRYWDCTYDQYMVVPTLGGTIEIENLTQWFNIWTIGEAKQNRALQKTVLRTMWSKARKYAGDTTKLLEFLRGWAKANPKVLALYEEDDLRVG